MSCSMLIAAALPPFGDDDDDRKPPGPKTPPAPPAPAAPLPRDFAAEIWDLVKDTKEAPPETEETLQE